MTLTSAVVHSPVPPIAVSGVARPGEPKIVTNFFHELHRHG
jgi:hypothetical protein